MTTAVTPIRGALPDRLRARLAAAEAEQRPGHAPIPVSVAELRAMLALYDAALSAVDTNQARVAMLRGYAGQAATLLAGARELLGRDVTQELP